MTATLTAQTTLALPDLEIPLICEYCGRKVRRAPSLVRGHVYCTNGCAIAGKRSLKFRLLARFRGVIEPRGEREESLARKAACFHAMALEFIPRLAEGRRLSESDVEHAYYCGRVDAHMEDLRDEVERRAG
jgi:hypothetical protein